MLAELGVDDDNEPAPENNERVETNSKNEVDCFDWTGDAPGVCERMENGYRFEKSKLIE